jgi:Tol biopolymer transport system component
MNLQKRKVVRMFNKYFYFSLLLAFLLCLSCEDDPVNGIEEEWPDFTFGTPTNLGVTVNSPANESSPSISADGLELYFGSDREGGFGNSDIWVSTRASVDDDWSAPVNLGAVVNTDSAESTPSISDDGLTLYFSDWIAPRPGGQGSVDLWVTTRASKSDPWTTPVNLGPTVNSSGFDVTPEISSDGLELYFESDRSGSYGFDDLYVCTRATTNDPWGEAQNLGSTINGELWEHCPTISYDGLILFYDLDIPGDILVTRRTTHTDNWQSPVNLGREYSDHYAADISADFSILYFTSGQAGGQGGADLWQLPIVSK